MSDTPVSLLDRLRLRPDPESWQRLVSLYKPLIQTWLRRYALQQPDVDDLVQEVLGTVVREVPRFQHNQRPGAFRCWLRTILGNRLRVFWEAQRSRPVTLGDSDFADVLDQLED